MALITNYSTLQTEIANRLNRDDLTAHIPGLIQTAEARLKRDNRAKLLVDGTPLTTVAATSTTALPGGLDSIQALAHQGPTYFGEIDIVDPGKLTDRLQWSGGSNGVPRVGAISENGSNVLIRWAPTPDAAYALLFQYWAKIVSLSASNPTNRMLLAHPDIYLYAALSESAPFLKDDDRIPVWEGRVNTALEDLHQSTQRRAYSGSLVRRPKIAIP